MNTDTIDSKFKEEIFDRELDLFFPPAFLNGKPFVPTEEIRDKCGYLHSGQKCEVNNTCAYCVYTPRD